MSSIIKKIGTIRLDKDVNIEDVVHFGAPKYIRVSENGSSKNFNAYELFVEEDTKKKK